MIHIFQHLLLSYSDSKALTAIIPQKIEKGVFFYHKKKGQRFPDIGIITDVLTKQQKIKVQYVEDYRGELLSDYNRTSTITFEDFEKEAVITCNKLQIAVDCLKNKTQ